MGEQPKSVTLGLPPPLHAYALAHSHVDPLLEELAAVTRERYPDRTAMLTAPEQGTLLTLLARALRARHVVEVGTFTGASALALARGVDRGGVVRCFERDPEPLEVARAFWARAGVAERIRVHLGDARELLPELPADPPIDLAFLDADKEAYPRYLDLVLQRLAPHGLVLADNTLASGRVLQPDEGIAAEMHAFNQRVAGDAGLTAVLLPFADGVTVLQRRARA